MYLGVEKINVKFRLPEKTIQHIASMADDLHLSNNEFVERFLISFWNKMKYQNRWDLLSPVVNLNDTPLMEVTYRISKHVYDVVRGHIITPSTLLYCADFRSYGELSL